MAKTMKKKIQKVYQDNSFGFPVILLNVPMIEVRGEWVPNVNQAQLQQIVIKALVLKNSRLSGDEVRFIRLYSQMTLEGFAERFDVTHPAVLKWEKTKKTSTGMNWTTEKDIRLFALGLLKPNAKNFLNTYEMLKDVAQEKQEMISIDVQDLAA
jgi:DNA-binding transcriptional regulator YiaG